MSNHARRGRGTSTAIRSRLAANDAQRVAVVFGSGKGDGSLLQDVTIGDVLYLVSVPPAGASEELLMAFSARATATVSGHCLACGARRHVAGTGHKTARGVFRHEHECPAADDNIIAALEAEGFHL